MRVKADRQTFGSRVRWWAPATIPLVVGFALRAHYVLRAEPFVDEPTTLLVAQAIARSGVPVLPSGLFYGNDLPFSYLAGGLVALLGPHLEIIRWFSVTASLATLALVYQTGYRLLSPWTGWGAALLLALSPEAILWGGRARAYALLGLLVFLATWWFFRGVKADRPLVRRLGWLSLILALFVHPEAILLWPAFILGAGWIKGWRWWFRPGPLLEGLLGAAACAARYGWQLALARGWMSGLETPTGSRPPLEPGGAWLLRLQQLAPFFLDPHRLPWTVLSLLALVVGARMIAKERQTETSRTVLFFSLCLWLPPVEMLILLGSTYQSPRYLTMLLPISSLLAGYGLDWLLSRLQRFLPSHTAFFMLSMLASVALFIGFWPGAASAANTREKGFRSAFEYVRQHWRPGDRVATVAPAYSHYVLGRSDFFTLGKGFEEFVYCQDGQWLDRWLGSPLIRSAEELNQVLSEDGRLWFVSDESRFRQRFDPAFAQMVWLRMDLMAKPDQVLVFVSQRRPAPAVSRAVNAVFGGQVALSRYDLGLADQQPADRSWGEVVARPGQSLPLTLYWQAAAPIERQYTVFVHLIGADQQRYAQDDGPPLNGLQPMIYWQQGETLPDRRNLILPADLPAGRYRLEVGLYSEDGERLPVADAAGQSLGEALILDFLQVMPADGSLPLPGQMVQADLTGNGDRIRLLGYTLAEKKVSRDGVLNLTLYWQAVNQVSTDYTVFVHLLDANDQIQAQGDGPPVSGFYPSSFWDLGEIVIDQRQVWVPADALPGTYRLAVGLYLLSTGQRLRIGQDDRIVLDEIEIQ